MLNSDHPAHCVEWFTRAMVIEWWFFTGPRLQGSCDHLVNPVTRRRRLYTHLERMMSTGVALDVKYTGTRQLDDIFVCFDIPTGDTAGRRRAELMKLMEPWYRSVRPTRLKLKEE